MYLYLSIVILFFSQASSAYPLVSSAVGVANTSGEIETTIYKDHENNVYWYLPNSIEPVKNIDGSVNRPIVRPDYFNFSFRGQVKSPESSIQQFATNRGISRDRIIPIPFEFSRNVYCTNFAADSGVYIDYPKKIGNYGELVPITVFSRNPKMISILDQTLGEPMGISCTVDVGFKAVVEGCAIHYTADMKTIYERFEANAHGGILFVEVDIHSLLESLYREGYIKITRLIDRSIIDPNETDSKAKAAFESVMDLIVKAMFERVTQLPSGAMAGRTKAFSLRTDFRRNAEYLKFEGDFEEQGVVTKESTIGIRVSKGTF